MERQQRAHQNGIFYGLAGGIFAVAMLSAQPAFIPAPAVPHVRNVFAPHVYKDTTHGIAQLITDEFSAAIVKQFIEEVQNFRAATIIIGDIAGNPKLVKDQGQFKKDIITWKNKIDADLQLIEIALSSNIQPSYAKLISLGSALAAYAEALYEATAHQLQPQHRYVPTQQHTTELTARCKAQVQKELGVEETQARALGTAYEPVTDVTLQQRMLANLADNITKKQIKLADTLREYGLTVINKTATSAHDAYRRFVNTTAVRNGWPLAMGGAIAVVAVWLAAKTYAEPFTLAGTVATQLTIKGVEYLATQKTTLSRMASRAIDRLKGVENKENRSYEDPLLPVTVEECEMKKETLIGAEAEFDRLISEIEYSVTGFKQGKKEFLKGSQRCFQFVAPAGQGKTYLMQQIKIAIAEKNRDLGLEISFVALTPEWLGKGGTIRYFIEKAQKENKGIVLWLDEIHLAKAQKDGDRSALLELLAETEWINKSNHPIWLFVATNEGGHGDKALTRDGRFVIIELYKYLLEHRIAFLEKQLEKRGVKIFETQSDYQKALAQGDVIHGAVVLFKDDIALLAQQAHGCTPATLNQVISTASNDAHGGAPTLAHLQRRMFEKVFKFTRGFDEMQLPEQQEVAVYQAGRILIYILSCQQRNFPVPLFVMATSSAIAIPFNELAAYNLTQPIVVNPNMERRRTFGDLFAYDPRELLPYNGTNIGKEDEIKMRLAGICAQQLLLDRVNDEYSAADRDRAYEQCKKLILLAQGFTKVDSLSKATREKTLQAAEERFIQYRAEDDALLRKHRTVLEAITTRLLSNPEQPYIMGQEVVALLAQEQGSVTNVTPIA